MADRLQRNAPGVPQTLTQLKFVSVGLAIGAIVTSSMDGGRYGYVSTYVVMVCGFLVFAFVGIPTIIARRQGRASSSYYFGVVFSAWLLMTLWIGLCGFLASLTYHAMHSHAKDELPMQMWLGVTLALAVLETVVMVGVAVLTEKEWRRIRYPDPLIGASTYVTF
ncbi:hypothetical protein CVT24_003404 [Panaeolus cyanescens]|uniref:Uncharacterized protein n=1 Tax=Panaeolus cyanescens TaxID=181874 RepID=A0A409Y792_9AGAR|nr:hypothetical protein CVT24_003404 [Panaeolus cyanescens]